MRVPSKSIELPCPQLTTGSGVNTLEYRQVHRNSEDITRLGRVTMLQRAQAGFRFKEFYSRTTIRPCSRSFIAYHVQANFVSKRRNLSVLNPALLEAKFEGRDMWQCSHRHLLLILKKMTNSSMTLPQSRDEPLRSLRSLRKDVNVSYVNACILRTG